MRKIGESLVLGANDIVGYLNCRHLSSLDQAVAEGLIPNPAVRFPRRLHLFRKRGAIHEQNYIRHLTEAGLGIIRIDGVGVTEKAVSETLAAMKQGTDVIVQGALSGHGWAGRADILHRVDKPSAIGDWSYEVTETGLARETKSGTILQLCLYTDLLGNTQGIEPEYMHVVAPWSGYERQPYRFASYAAYYRKVKRALQESLADSQAEETYPDPRPHCDICRWREHCDRHRREDDHLCLVAGISKLQINELKQRGIATMQDLSEMPLPLAWKPNHGSADSYTRLREQARIQVEARTSGERRIELLPVEHGFGFTRLPEPAAGDIFFVLEGDPFVGEHGLEYLFGYLFTNENGEAAYQHHWAFTRAEEKQSFEKFVDFVMARWEQSPGLHIYHDVHFEPSAMKRLMGRYATREEEIDRMLRAGLFVALTPIARQAIRASVENYSLKQLEPFFAFKRDTPLADASAARIALQGKLELEDVPSITGEIKTAVRANNLDNCRAVAGLRDWMESLRDRLTQKGIAVPRPEPGDGSPNERTTDWLQAINALVENLTAGIPADPEDRDEEQQARWILANILDWHRREEKAVWWEYFRLAALSAEDLFDERAGLSGLELVDETGETELASVHRYHFPSQETELRGGEDLHVMGGGKLGKVHSISVEEGMVEIEKHWQGASIHPQALYAHTYVNTKVLAISLMRLGEYVVEHGLRGEGEYLAARDLLLREAPRAGGKILQKKRETTVDAAVRLCEHLTGGILPIQGPPGAGKTYTGARMICELVRLGKTVGITANSHKVIRNLIDATIRAADENGVTLHCCHKAAKTEKPQPRLSFARKSEHLIAELGDRVNVGGGTAWLWARKDAFETVDVLFVDESAQMSLANVLAVSQAAQTVVLIGDPQQLDQPTQGSHPEGTGSSALDHILDGQKTIASSMGLFLEETWRLHPEICGYTSELFYDGKLRSKAGLEKQMIRSPGQTRGAGLRYLPVKHEGNQTCSPEEAHAVHALVSDLLESKASWVDRDGREREIMLDDILIIAPYNAQVFEIQKHLPRGRVGTVDKFQGQEAPVAIYSMATSSSSEAPRGMEFLYSPNRLNVATTRAKCVSILVCSPLLFEPECHTPRQIQLANAFCRYLGMANQLPNREP